MEYSVKKIGGEGRREDMGGRAANGDVREESEEVEEVIGVWSHLVQQCDRIELLIALVLLHFVLLLSRCECVRVFGCALRIVGFLGFQRPNPEVFLHFLVESQENTSPVVRLHREIKKEPIMHRFFTGPSGPRPIIQIAHICLSYKIWKVFADIRLR